MLCRIAPFRSCGPFLFLAACIAVQPRHALFGGYCKHFAGSNFRPPKHSCCSAGADAEFFDRQKRRVLLRILLGMPLSLCNKLFSDKKL